MHERERETDGRTTWFIHNLRRFTEFVLAGGACDDDSSSGAVDVLDHDDEFSDDGCESSGRFRLAGCISIERSVCRSKSLCGCSKRAASSSADAGTESGGEK